MLIEPRASAVPRVAASQTVLARTTQLPCMVCRRAASYAARGRPANKAARRAVPRTFTLQWAATRLRSTVAAEAPAPDQPQPLSAAEAVRARTAVLFPHAPS